jgi:signal transduction histidine kinase
LRTKAADRHHPIDVIHHEAEEAAPGVLNLWRGSPFRGERFLPKIAPFALAAVLAEFSLLAPPGVQSPPAAVVSVVLLVATALGIALLPWERLPREAAVVIPLLYCSSVLALSLAAGTNSGLAIVALVPLLWTAMFHEKWESACVVAAVVVVVLVISMVQHDIHGTTLRRGVLWGLLGIVMVAAVHGLRDRLRAAHVRAERFQSYARQAELTDERLRIALALQEKIVKRVFDTTITLNQAAHFETNDETRRLIANAVAGLDETVTLLRRAVFDLEDPPKGADPTVDAQAFPGSYASVNRSPWAAPDPDLPPPRPRRTNAMPTAITAPASGPAT